MKESAKKGLPEEKPEPNAEHKRSRVRPLYKAPVACHIDSHYVLQSIKYFITSVAGMPLQVNSTATLFSLCHSGEFNAILVFLELLYPNYSVRLGVWRFGGVLLIT